MNPKIDLFTEVFPVQISTIPRLFAYKLEVSTGNISMIGGKLSYQLRKIFQGHWVWTRSNRIISDNRQDVAEIMKVVKKLWHEQPNVFGGLKNVYQDYNWQLAPQEIADFVSRGLFMDIDRDIKKILNEKREDLGTAYVERAYEVRGWVVKGKPAVSISISSRLIHKQDLKMYASGISKSDDLIGLWVVDKTSSLKGEIVGIGGDVGSNRERLLALAQREEMEELIRNAPNDEMIVKVQTRSGYNPYEYITSALRIIVRMEDFPRFNIDAKKALKTLRFEPYKRYTLLREISNVAMKKRLVLPLYDSKNSSDRFLTSKDVGFNPSLKFGGNNIHKYDKKQLLQHFYNDGIYKRSNEFQTDKPIRIGVINALNSVSINEFLSKVQRELKHFHFKSDIITEVKIKDVSRDYLEKAINKIQESNLHIILAFFPGEVSEENEEWGAYHNFKSLTIGRGIPSQVIYQSTLNNKYAIPNIVMGILGKTGNIPFVLADPLPYADLVIGIDVARERKKRLSGSINATAIARIYFSNGEFIRYVIHDTPLEGETIPENVLQRLFPLKEFKDKRVVIHRDGYFRGDEKKALMNWAQKIGATFYLVEVIKTGTPRLYSRSNGRVQQPPKGSAFILSEKEAFLVSSLPPFRDATPQPLRIRTEPPFTIHQAIHSVLSLTLLHYGSLRPPRAPVTIHYSDKIAYLALRGIKPKETEGNIPFWL